MRQLAVSLRARWEAGDAEAVDEIRTLHPRFGGTSVGGVPSAALSDADAELVTARTYGFATWRQLETFVTHSGGGSGFQQLACLSYFQSDRPANRERARAMLDADPTLGTRDVWSAACVGDAQAVTGFLDADPSLVDQRGGYFDWEPLLYACCSRLDLAGRSTLAVARLLIERGADPNAHFMWGGQYRFTALTGAFGEGEMGPVNQQYLADHGAEAVELDSTKRFVAACMSADGETARMLLEEEPDLIEQTQAADPQLLVDAAGSNRLAAVRLMLELGFDPGARDATPTTPLHQAAFHGHVEMAQLLLDGGAKLGARDAYFIGTPLQWAMTAGQAAMRTFLASREIGIFDAVLCDNADRVAALLDGDPALLETSIRHEHGRNETHSQDWQTPLAFAVLRERPAAVRLLLERGARTDVRDRDGRSLAEIAREGVSAEITALLEDSAGP